MLPEYLEICQKYQEHFSELLDIGCSVVDVPDYSAPQLVRQGEMLDFCAHCAFGRNDELTTHLYGCHEAHRWNGLYIYYCPLGLTFIAASLSSAAGELTGGIVLGPLVMGDMQDTLYDLSAPEMAWAVSRLSSFSTAKVRHIGEILRALTAMITSAPPVNDVMLDKERVLKEIYDAREFHAEIDSHSAEVLLKFENDMHSCVLNGDKTAAMGMINDVLAHIYVYSNYDIGAIRARLLELLVILSRASIEAGTDPVETFRMTEDYIHLIAQHKDADKLALWISGIIRRFILQAFDLARAKHSDVVFKVANHIKRNCAGHLTLDTLAKEVYLSKSYLSSIFKKELGISVTAYITNVRIDKSKRMLLEGKSSMAYIAAQCGFKDQSYFTKVFKKATGISPLRFKYSLKTK
jgi:AraC-like DNA-binding protein/ligand-binding sensor protein